MKKATNKNLREAKVNKNDEFYTQLPDIENELINYTSYFKDKVIYCNCDSSESNFLRYFNDNRANLGFRKLLSSSIRDGIDFRSPEAIELLKGKQPFKRILIQKR